MHRRLMNLVLDTLRISLCLPLESLPGSDDSKIQQVGYVIEVESQVPPFELPLLSPSPPAFNLSQHQGLFQ